MWNFFRFFAISGCVISFRISQLLLMLGAFIVASRTKYLYLKNGESMSTGETNQTLVETNRSKCSRWTRRI